MIKQQYISIAELADLSLGGGSSPHHKAEHIAPCADMLLPHISGSQYVNRTNTVSMTYVATIMTNIFSPLCFVSFTTNRTSLTGISWVYILYIYSCQLGLLSCIKNISPAKRDVFFDKCSALVAARVLRRLEAHSP